MRTPSAAFAWELWQRHGKRLTIMAGLILAFIFVYPLLCASSGINLASANTLDDVANKMTAGGNQGISAQRIIVALYSLFLACGPAGAMCLSLLYVAWMFTLAEINPKTKQPMPFPFRLFNLPVSTPYLFWWFLLVGQAAIVAVYGCWVYLVRQPHVDIFDAYQNCFSWMTLLALAQGITWALAEWPRTRALLSCIILLGIICSPGEPGGFKSPWLLAPLYLLSIVLARVGLQKMRHGQWQGCDWEKIGSAIVPSREMRGPKRFASPAQAQLWFAWRRFGRIACYLAGALAITPVVIHVVLRFVMRWGPMENNTVATFTGFLLVIPVFLGYMLGMFPFPNELSFMFDRPTTNGQIIMARIKASAITTVVSWLLVLVALGALPLLGNPDAAWEKSWLIEPRWRPLIILGCVFLTWRNCVINLSFVWSGKRWLVQSPALAFIVLYAVAGALAILSNYPVYWDLFCRLLPGILACLVALKFLAAFLTFRVSIQRSLLAPSAMAGYLVVWVLLAAVLLIPALIVFHDRGWILTLCLGIVLLIPLARIGLGPITMAWHRHA